MRVTAKMKNSQGKNDVILQTDYSSHSIVVPPKPTGFGSSASGGELLFLALATCYCNDTYREAARRQMKIVSVEVTVEGDFGGIGEPAMNVTYSTVVSAHATKAEIEDLIQHTDTIAEVQNTLRRGTPVTLSHSEAKAM